MELKVQSEIYSESDFQCTSSDNSNSIVKIIFKYDFQRCSANKPVIIDEDGDLVVSRRKPFNLHIELSRSTTISMVGFQLWRGGLVLADFILDNGPSIFNSKSILELGSGVGLTSIVAGFFAEKVVATDAPIQGILDLIRRNFKRNLDFVKSDISVVPLDFYAQEWPKELLDIVKKTDIVLAADVIYDDSLTEAFVGTLTKILSTKRKKTVYIALEKRYVFTVANLSTVAPCYEYFLECIKKNWSQPPMSKWQMKCLPIEFTQYFTYERNEHIVLWQIKNH